MSTHCEDRCSKRLAFSPLFLGDAVERGGRSVAEGSGGSLVECGEKKIAEIHNWRGRRRLGLNAHGIQEHLALHAAKRASSLAAVVYNGSGVNHLVASETEGVNLFGYGNLCQPTFLGKVSLSLCTTGLSEGTFNGILAKNIETDGFCHIP